MVGGGERRQPPGVDHARPAVVPSGGPRARGGPTRVTEMYELHRRAGEMLAANVRRIGSDQWRLATPCTEWDVRALLHHIAWSNLWVAPLVEGRGLAEVAPTLEGDVLGDDPLAVTLRSIDESSDAFEAGSYPPVRLFRGSTP